MTADTFTASLIIYAVTVQLHSYITHYYEHSLIHLLTHSLTHSLTERNWDMINDHRQNVTARQYFVEIYNVFTAVHTESCFINQLLM